MGKWGSVPSVPMEPLTFDLGITLKNKKLIIYVCYTYKLSASCYT